MVYAKKIILTAALALAAISTDLSAKITLPPFFSDNMVLQHSSEVKLWGKAESGAKVKVMPSWSRKTLKVTAGEDGSWSVILSTPSPGGPYNITVWDSSQAVILKDVLCGEVWLCGGQSNMEMPVGGSWGKVNGWEKELAQASSHDSIRLLRVERNISPAPAEGLDIASGGWTKCTSESLDEFSATAWFYGKYLNEALGVPVGLVESCWGGTIIEAWMNAETLRGIERYRGILQQMASMPVEKADRLVAFESNLAGWEQDMRALDPAFPGQIVPGAGTGGWTVAQVPGYLQNQGIEGMHGFFWMKKDIVLDGSWAGKDLRLLAGKVDDNDFAYFNGELIGHTEGCILQREYTVPGSLVKAGVNTIALRVMDTGGLSGILGEDREICLELPGGQTLPLSGEWWCKECMDIGAAPLFPVNMDMDPNQPSCLYNSMIWPLRDMVFKGAIWYQGESNASDAAHYKDLMPAMIHDWRQLFGEGLPFYYAQIANYLEPQKGPERSEWAELREAQLQSLNVKGTGMAVLIDIGEAGDIHPKNKAEVGRRLALNALALTYGQDIEYSGPVYDGYSIEESAVRIRFKFAEGGLRSADGEDLKGFYIAGADHVFHPAQALIEGGTLLVSSPEVQNPVSVRYGWANNPPCNLIGATGLPASPFRTDSWTK